MKTTIIYFFLLLTLWSCSQGGTKVNVNVSNKFALSAMPGGAMLYIENLDTGVVSATAITGESYKVTLNNANWKFSVIGWDGPSNLSGKMYCGFTTANLTGGNLPIDISITENACDTTEVSPNSLRTGAYSNPLSLDSCNSLAAGIAAGNCNGSRGLGNSYKVRLVDYSNLKLDSVTQGPAGISSACIKGTAATSFVPAAINLPYGRADGLYATVVESYYDFNCSTGKRNYFLPKGLAQGLAGNSSRSLVIDATGPHLYMLHSGVAVTGASFIGSGLSPANLINDIRFSNNSGGDVSLVSASLSGAGAQIDFVGGFFPGTGGDCVAGTSITTSSNCTIKVSFNATALGNYSKTLNVSYTEAGDSTVKNIAFPLSASVVTPAVLTFTNASSLFNLGPVYQGTPDSVRNLVVKNTGAYTAFFSDINGFSAPVFKNATSTCGGSLEPGLSCIISMSLQTSITTNISQMINVVYNDGQAGQVLSHALSGDVLSAADIVPAQPTYNFGYQNFGASPLTQIVNLTNSTTHAATSLVFPANNSVFYITSNSCTSSLAAGASCSFVMNFMASTPASFTQNFTYTYNNGFSPSSKTITFSGIGITDSSVNASPVSFGNAAVGGFVDLTVQVANYEFGTAISGLNVVLLGDPVFTFKGGAYPGMGGTCGSTLPTNGTCNVVLRFSPTALTAFSGTFDIQFFRGSVQHSPTTISGIGTNPTTLSVSDSSMFDFGAGKIGTNYSKTFTVTNTGSIAATSLGLSGYSAPFAISGNSCAGTLAAGASCTFNAIFMPAFIDPAVQTISFNYHDGVSPQTNGISVTGTGIIQGAVTPFYGSATQWNDYVVDNNPGSLFNDSDVACNPVSDLKCQHGGELRKLTVNGVTSCAGVTFTENLGAFNWECNDSGTWIVLRSKGFLKGKGLRNLISSSAWIPNGMQVKRAGVVIFESAPTSWYTNPIINLNDVNSVTAGSSSLPLNIASISSGIQGLDASGGTSGPLNVIAMNLPSAIYTISNPVLTAPLIISDSKISLVTLGTGSLSTGLTASTCNNLTGSAVSPNVNSLICAGAAPFNWIEAKAFGVTSAVQNILHLSKPKFHRVHNSEFSVANKGINVNHVITPIPLPSIITNTNVFGITTNALNAVNASNLQISESAFFNSNIGMDFSGTGTKNIIERTVVLKNAQYGLNIASNINGNRITQFQAHENFYGIYIQSAGNILNTIKAGGNDNALYVGGASSTNNTLVNLLLTGNANSGLVFSNTMYNTVVNATLAMNGTNLLLGGSSQQNTLINIVANISGSSSPSVNFSSAGNNVIKNMAIAKGAPNISMSSSSNNMLTNVLTGDAVTSDCVITTTGTGNSLNGSTLANGTFAGCTGTINAVLDMSFKGPATSDSTNPKVTGSSTAYASLTILDFIDFENLFRYWGTTSGDAQKCSATGNCVAWDWRVKLGAPILETTGNGMSPNDTFTDAGTCPSQASGSQYTIDSQATPNTFLTLATETIDGIGDDDGLCESNETCIYAPNFGVYQGEGFLTGICNFTNGMISSVSLRAYSSFSAP